MDGRAGQRKAVYSAPRSSKDQNHPRSGSFPLSTRKRSVSFDSLALANVLPSLHVSSKDCYFNAVLKLHRSLALYICKALIIQFARHAELKRSKFNHLSCMSQALVGSRFLFAFIIQNIFSSLARGRRKDSGHHLDSHCFHVVFDTIDTETPHVAILLDWRFGFAIHVVSC